MPPVGSTEDYLDLVAAIEATASRLSTPVAIEGTTPPSDCRLNNLRVTPDPGVIEVNMHPAHSWEELVTQTTVLYEGAPHAARHRKFISTDAHPERGKPYRRRRPTAPTAPQAAGPAPQSEGYWHNHHDVVPSRRPDEPASTVDQARNDSIRVRDRVCDSPNARAPTLAGGPGVPQPLIDVSGDTHRAEFAPKLYDPDSASGAGGAARVRDAAT
jgi:uncharacterized protein (DUF2126 family)